VYNQPWHVTVIGHRERHVSEGMPILWPGKYRCRDVFECVEVQSCEALSESKRLGPEDRPLSSAEIIPSPPPLAPDLLSES